LKKYDEAIADFSQAIQIESKSDLAYYNRGNVYSDIGQYEKAVEDYNHALEINPQYAKAYYKRGDAYYHLSQYEISMKDFEQALALCNDDTGLCQVAQEGLQKVQGVSP